MTVAEAIYTLNGLARDAEEMAEKYAVAIETNPADESTVVYIFDDNSRLLVRDEDFHPLDEE